MMQELLSAKCAAQKIECQKIEIDELRRELLNRSIALNAYDCQYQQLMVRKLNKCLICLPVSRTEIVGKYVTGRMNFCRTHKE